MIRSEGLNARKLLSKTLHTELAIVGGGLSGVCAAITAARKGVHVVLVQDRPVLGGNSSSEVRLWVLGATSHMGNNNRWSREGGLIDEILVENTFRNKDGNPLIFDTILLEKVKNESRITLLLNTAVYDVKKSGDDEISEVIAFCSQNSTSYTIKSPLFCDASGDGIIGFLSGAAFRMGAENESEFNEKFAPSKEYGELLGHSLYFYSKDTGKPVSFIAPGFSINVVDQIPRFRSFHVNEYGCKLWWLEYGGRLDTIHDTEEIKWELWKIVYGAWDYIKNSGEFPEAENLTLEWVGTIPGKRESRRFEGDYILKQQDIIEQRTHDDAVAYGGWSIDLHPADGVFSEKPGCNQWHSKGIYQIPYRCLYSRNIKNLLLAGRLISASHVAFASSRVMATSAHIAQAVGMAAFFAIRNKLMPSALVEKKWMDQLQNELLKTGHHIPGFASYEPDNLINSADIYPSSEFKLSTLPKDGYRLLVESTGQLLPLTEGNVPSFEFDVIATTETYLEIELRTSGKIGNFTPDVLIEKKSIKLQTGEQSLKLDFSTPLPYTGYGFLIFMHNTNVQLAYSEHRLTGILSVFNTINKAVSNFGKQIPIVDIGVDEFEFWCPQRRPHGQNIALKISPPLQCFGANHVISGTYRPTLTPNVWVSSLDDSNPSLLLNWEQVQTISRIVLFFDTDADHPMETVLMGHPENVMPFCVRNYVIKDENNHVIYKKQNNYQTIDTIELEKPLLTKSLKIELEHPSPVIPAGLFGLKCY